MNKTKCYFIDVYGLAIVGVIGFAAWKVVHFWKEGIAEKTGHSIDASINDAAKKLEKAALALEDWVTKNPGETMGKGVDQIVADAKKTLDNTTRIVQHALDHSK